MTNGDAQIHNYYLAALPDSATMAQMEDVWQQKGSGEPFRRQSLHLTMLEFANREIILEGQPRMQRAIEGLGLSGFTLELDRLMTFGGRPDNKALVLTMQGQSAAVAMMAKQLHTALKRSGLQPKSSGRTPHVTLAYRPGFPAVRFLDRPISWRINQLTLVDSLLGKGKLVPLASWPLP